MEWFTSNSFFALLLLVCIGMHVFGHGHGHGHSKHGADNVDDAHGEHDETGRKT